MLTLYTVLETLHVLAVICWLGAGITQQVMAVATGRGKPYADQLAWFGKRWFPAVSGITGLLGILLWIDGPWDFGELWIGLAVAGWLASMIIGATQLGPRAERYAASGATDTKVWAEFERLVRIDTVILLLIVADMVIKPGL